METRQRGGQALVIARKPPKTRQPSEGTLHHPAPGQHHEAALGLGEFDDLQLNAVPGGSLGGFLARVTLIDIGQIEQFSFELAIVLC